MNADLFEHMDHPDHEQAKRYRCVNHEAETHHFAIGTGQQPPCCCGAWFDELETDDARRHREDREAAQRERKRQREEVEERRRRPLSGSRGDFEQGRLFGKEELFQ